MLDETSIVSAVAGSDFVVHSASPFVRENPDDPDTLIKPAVEGTEAVLRACRIHDVQRLVITSDIAAVRNLKPEDKPANNTLDESFWSDPNNPGIPTYAKSKTLAEKAAWDFQKSLPEDERFDIVSLLPALMMGPSYKTDDFVSGNIMRDMMASSGPVERVIKGMVDVRDVARAHLFAIKIEAAKNRRFLLVGRNAWMKEMAECLAAEYNPKGFDININESPNDPPHEYKYDTAASREILGLEYSPVELSWLDMAKCLLESGFISKPGTYKEYEEVTKFTAEMLKI